MTEDALHEAVANYLTLVIAPPGHLGRGACWFSIEHRNARSAVEGALRKRRGVISGIPDVFVFHAGRAYGIELKRERDLIFRQGKTSRAQKALHDVLGRVGVPVWICRSVVEVEQQLEMAGIPLRGRIAA